MAQQVLGHDTAAAGETKINAMFAELYAGLAGLQTQQSTDEATMTAFQTDLDRLAGQKGGVLITDTAAHAGSFMAIAALETDVVIAAMTLASGWTGSMVGRTIPAGTSIVIGFTSVTLVSGSAIAYSN